MGARYYVIKINPKIALEKDPPDKYMTLHRTIDIMQAMNYFDWRHKSYPQEHLLMRKLLVDYEKQFGEKGYVTLTELAEYEPHSKAPSFLDKSFEVIYKGTEPDAVQNASTGLLEASTGVSEGANT